MPQIPGKQLISVPVGNLVRFVDNLTTVPTVDQTGSTNAPFSTIAAALANLKAAVSASSADIGVIYVAPSPTSYGNVDLTDWDDLHLTITGSGAKYHNPAVPWTGVTLGNLSNIGCQGLALTNMTVGTLSMKAGHYGALPNRCDLQLRDVQATGIPNPVDTDDSPDLTCGGFITFTGNVYLGVLNVFGPSSVADPGLGVIPADYPVQFLQTVSAQNAVVATGTSFNSLFSLESISLQDSTVTTEVNSGAELYLTNVVSNTAVFICGLDAILKSTTTNGDVTCGGGSVSLIRSTVGDITATSNGVAILLNDQSFASTVTAPAGTVEVSNESGATTIVVATSPTSTAGYVYLNNILVDGMTVTGSVLIANQIRSVGAGITGTFTRNAGVNADPVVKLLGSQKLAGTLTFTGSGSPEYWVDGLTEKSSRGSLTISGTHTKTILGSVDSLVANADTARGLMVSGTALPITALADMQLVQRYNGGIRGVSLRSFVLPKPEDYLPPGTDPLTVTDWAPYINAMLAANSDCGLSHNFTYVVNGLLTLNSGNHLYGYENSEIQLSNTFDGTGNLFSGLNVTDVHLVGFSINGNTRLTGGSTTGHVICINGTSSQLRFRNLNIRQWGASSTIASAAIRLIGTVRDVGIWDNSFVQTSSSVGQGLAAVDIFATGSGISISRNWCDGGSNNGLRTVIGVNIGSGDALINDNVIHSPSSCGIQVQYGSVHTLAARIVISNNTIYDCPAFGINNASNGGPGVCMIIGNYISYCSGNAVGSGPGAISCFNSTDIVGNFIYKTGYLPDGVTLRVGAAYDIYVPTTLLAAGNFTIVGNRLIGAYSGSLTISSAVRVNISGNIINGTPFPIAVSASGATFHSQHEWNIDGNICDCSGIVGFALGIQVGENPYFAAGALTRVRITNNVVRGPGFGSTYGGIYIGQPGPGLVCAGNSVYNFPDGIYFPQGAEPYMDGRVIVEHNVLSDCVNGINIYGVLGTSNWLLVGSNQYINCTNRLVGSGGSGPALVRECEQLYPRRKILSAAAPLVDELTGVVGDQILLTTPLADGTIIKHCTTAGNPGVWGSIKLNSGLPVPEDYVPANVSFASIDTAGTWHTYINAMLTAVASAGRVAGMTPGKAYKISGGVTVPLGVEIWDFQGAYLTGNFAGSVDAITINNVNNAYWMKIIDARVSSNSLANDSSGIKIISSSYVKLIRPGVSDWGSTTGGVTNTVGIEIAGSCNHIHLYDPWCDDIKSGNTVEESTGIQLAASVSVRTDIMIVNPVVTGYGNTKVCMGIDGASQEVVITNPQLRGSFGGALTIGYSGNTTRCKVHGGMIIDGKLGGIYIQGIAETEIYGTELFACGGRSSPSISAGAVGIYSSGKTLCDGVKVRNAGYDTAGVVGAVACAAFYSPTTIQAKVHLRNCEAYNSSGYNYRLQGLVDLVCQNNYGENPGYGIGAQTADFYCLSNATAPAKGIVSGNVSVSGPTGIGGGFSITAPVGGTDPFYCDVLNNQAYGNGNAGGFAMTVDVYGSVQNNVIKDYTYGIDWGTGGSSLGIQMFIENNEFWNTTNALNLTNIAAGTSWMYVGEQKFGTGVTNKYTISGAGAARVKKARIMTGLKKDIYSDAAPTAGQGTWAVGDTIRPETAISGNIVLRVCSVAGDPGTWASVLSTGGFAPAAFPANVTSSSSTTITFTQDANILFTGSGAISLTADFTGAVNGAEVRLFIPANQITTFAVDTNIAPVSAYVTSNFDPAAPYLFVMRYVTFPSNHEAVIAAGFRTADL